MIILSEEDVVEEAIYDLVTFTEGTFNFEISDENFPNNIKTGTMIIDSGTPFDGMYCDNDQTGGPHYDWDGEKRTPGSFFIGSLLVIVSTRFILPWVIKSGESIILVIGALNSGN